MTKIKIVTEPVVEILAEMKLVEPGILGMADWVREHRPDCTPEEGYENVYDLLPHGPIEGADEKERLLTDNEILVELSGRTCYHSYAEKAGRKTNREYIEHSQSGEHPHVSIMYHAKISFFLAGISRRLTHELIRNYVGADRTEEGNPSQESTRFTHHYGFYVAPPAIVSDLGEMKLFEQAHQLNYDEYCQYIDRQVTAWEVAHGSKPKGIDRKRIYEAAAAYLAQTCETSLIWTTNPVALNKLFRERGAENADAEFQRLVKKWKEVVLPRYPNLFPTK